MLTGHQGAPTSTASRVAVRAAGIPRREAGLVARVVLLEAVGLRPEGIRLLQAADWLLDRFRASVDAGGRHGVGAPWCTAS
ncbi:MAG: cation:dicarboxylase symporter family transporter [Chromatiales bacterium]